MHKQLETERLILKCIGYEDTVFFFKQFSDDDVNHYLYDTEPCASVDDARQWIAFYVEGSPEDRNRWIILLKENGEKIGTCGFHRLNKKTGEVETGYDLQPAFRHKGYMHEALTEMIRFAKAEWGVKRIYAHISEDNAASARTAESCGFRKTGEMYDEVFMGVKYPHEIFALDTEEV